MKRILLSAFVLFIAGIANAQLISVEFEEHYVHDGTVYEDAQLGTVNLDGYITYRLYANLTNADDFVINVSGNIGDPLSIQLTDQDEQFFQHPGGAAVGPMNAAIIGFVPLVAYDSYLTIGYHVDTDNPTYTAPTAIGGAGNPWLTNFEAGDGIYSDDFTGLAYFVLPGSENGIAGDDLRVSLGQFTVNNADAINMNLSFAGNVQVFTNGVSNSEFEEDFYYAFATTAEGGLGCTDPAADNYDSTAIVDDNSCEYPCTIAINAADLIITDACFGTLDGSVDVSSITGAQGSVLHSTNDGSFVVSSLFNGLPAGDYLYEVRDAEGCIASAPYTIEEGIEIVITENTVDSNNPSCFGFSDGQVCVEIAGGVAPYFTSLATADFSDEYSELCFTDLPSGNHVVFVQDDNGCIVNSEAIALNDPLPMAIELDALSAASCGDVADACGIALATGGQPSFTYEIEDWIEPQEENILCGLLPGMDYTVIATDANGCTVSGLLTEITGPAQVGVNANFVTDVSCFGSEDGEICVSGFGGNGNFGYSITDCEGFEFNDGCFDGLAAGDYLICAESDGCTGSDTFTVGAQSAITTPVITASGNTTFCDGGSVTLTSSIATNNMWSNGETTQSIIVTQSGDYTVAASYGACSTISLVTFVAVNLPDGCTDSAACNYNSAAICDDGLCTYLGCTNSSACNYDSAAGCDDGSCIECFGALVWNTTASMYYSDTLEVNIEITGGVDVYAAFASLQYDESLLLMVEDDPGDYLGTDVISSPAVDNNGVVEFGVTKVGSVAGSNGDGLFYTLRFIPVGPIELTSTQTLLSILNIEAYTSDGLPGALYYPESWGVEIVYEAEVWPGDLNHDLEVNVSDILPIGYFYGETGPTRPDASLQWEAQLCPLWDIGMEFPGDGFYKVFADGNGDGEIQLSDQVAVGFNINQVVSFIPEVDNTAMLLGGGSAPVMITSNSTPAPVVLPGDTEVSITLMATTDETNQNDFHGISWSMDFSSLGIDANEAVIDYSNSGMGELNNTMIALDYSTESQLDIAITRTTNDYTLGSFELCTVTIPVSGLSSGDYIVQVMVSESNDANGASVSTSSSNAIITVSNASGCTDSEACNYSPEASEDDGSCQYVLVYDVNGSLTPGLFESEAYLYYETEGSTYEWVCTGGVIISGNGSFQIEVTWAEQGVGELCVVETNAEGCVGEQFCIDVAVIPTNIGEEEQVNISIFPNPASTSFTIAADERFINTAYRLFDSQGKLVLQGTISANTTLVQTKDLSSGKYTLSISNGKQIVTETIFLQK
ncbi:MAG: hypothetical protein ACI8QW_000027 [Saprospiraceae bacterium]|jgi:hypothetical protein